MDEKDLEQLITPARAAEIKQVSKATIYKAVKENRLRAVYAAGAMAFLQADLDAWQPASYGGVKRAVVTRGTPKKEIKNETSS
ncbi:MAG: helix-turn-helix domain-containing protein [Capsulimonas sp.]|uniref:helix-turn-helix domain-containing protein n=1 Tax=Capsulimonas sp. TaxID=2494211 RepID=UPI003265A546